MERTYDAAGISNWANDEAEIFGNTANHSIGTTPTTAPVFIKQNRTDNEPHGLEPRNIQLQQWQQKIFASKPQLSPDAPIAVVLFSGGGGIEAGMVMAGIRPVIAVEFDPSDPDLSGKLADMHCTNFSGYGCKLIRRSVQDVARLNFPGFPRNPDFLHASPVCANFSQAKKGAEETDDDIAMAEAVAKAITTLQPKVFTLEQVPQYKHSTSWEIIQNQLKKDGYNITLSVLNMADYGVAQKERKRLIVAASKSFAPMLPEPTQRISWDMAIADLIPTLPDSTLTESQIDALARLNDSCPLLIQRTKQRGECRIVPSGELAHTLTKSMFFDGKGGHRSQVLDVYFPEDGIKQLPLKAIARLQTFPDWYCFAGGTGVAIGYSVPPLFAKQLFSCLVTQKQTAPKNPLRHHLDFYESPSWFVTEMCKHVHIEGTVLEPCSGEGAIASLLQHHPDITDVYTNDIDFDKPADFHFDATLPESWQQLPATDWVITNPPFGDKAASVVINAYNHAKKGIVMFLLGSFLEPCEDRANFLEQHPPTHVLSLPRYCFRKDKLGKRWATDKGGINCFVWLKDSKQQAIRVIPKEKILGFYKTADKAITEEAAIAILQTTCKKHSFGSTYTGYLYQRKKGDLLIWEYRYGDINHYVSVGRQARVKNAIFQGLSGTTILESIFTKKPE